MTSYRIFDKLQEIFPSRELPYHGIRLRTANFFFDDRIENRAADYHKMQEIENNKEVGTAFGS